MTGFRLLGASAIAMLIASPAFPQSALVGIDAIDDDIDQIQEDVQDDLAEGEDAARYALSPFAPGLSGGVSLGFSGTSGNTDTADLSIGGRLRYGAAPWNHTLGFAGEFSEDNDVRSKEKLYATYDANRYVTEDFYVFGLGSARYDKFASNEYDTFIGAGPGYRIVNTPEMAWRVQAGPGYRWLKDQDGNKTDEVAGIAASRFYYKLSETAYMTNDTDILYSDDSTLLTNDIGVTFRMTGSLSTRVSYLVEYNSDPLPGLDNTDNTLGVSLVYGF